MTPLTGEVGIAILADSHNLKPISGIMAFFKGPRSGKPPARTAKKRARAGARAKKKDPVFVNGERPRPMYIDYKDLELLGKLISRHGRIVSRRKSGCTAVSQHAVSEAIKRARFMALLPYVAE